MNGVYDGIMNDLGMVLLGTIPTDFTGFVVRKGVEVPTSFPEEAEGFKMRVPGMPMAIERYKAAYGRFQETLTAFCRSRNAGLLQLDVEQEVVPQLAALFESGRFVA